MAVCAPFDDPGAETVMAPVYVPAARPTGFTKTLRMVEVAPLEGLTKSQFPALDALAVKFSWAPLLKAVSGCAGGTAPPT
jgi:hypothetical protein